MGIDNLSDLADAVCRADMELPAPYYLSEVVVSSFGEPVARLRWNAERTEYVPAEPWSASDSEAAGRPVPATHWAWQIGGVWRAVCAYEHETWWDGADAESVAARPDDWWRPIADVPGDGTLSYWEVLP